MWYRSRKTPSSTSSCPRATDRAYDLPVFLTEPGFAAFEAPRPFRENDLVIEYNRIPCRL